MYSIHTETGWDLRPWPAVIAPRPAAEYKESIRDWKEVHACTVGTNDGQRDTKRPMSHFWWAESKNRSQEQKQDITHAPWTQHNQRGRPPKAHASAWPLDRALHMLRVRTQPSTSWGTRKQDRPVPALPPPRAAGAPGEPCLSFVSGLLPIPID